MTTRRSTLKLLATGATLAQLAMPSGHAQQPLLRQLTIVVAFPAGGATDAVARLVAEGLRGKYAETVIVENRAGGGGRIAAVHVKNAPADGSVMLFGPAFPMAIFPHIYKTLPYDPLTDFVPVATTSKGAFALSVGTAVPASVRTVADFLAWAKANPDNATYGAPAGGGQHFAGALFARQAGIPLRMVPYKGGAPSVVDVLGGHIASVVTPLPEVLPHVRDGKLRMLATTTDRRSPFAPEVPTMKELGYDVVFQDWSGFLAPARTSAEVVARANAAINEAVASPKVAAALQAQGTDADTNSPAEFARLYRQTWERYREVVNSTGFKAEE
jgi:tripartite-type tricarboxylate transporter receptor subunit TctC